MNYLFPRRRYFFFLFISDSPHYSPVSLTVNVLIIQPASPIKVLFLYAAAEIRACGNYNTPRARTHKGPLHCRCKVWWRMASVRWCICHSGYCKQSPAWSGLCSFLQANAMIRVLFNLSIGFQDAVYMKTIVEIRITHVVTCRALISIWIRAGLRCKRFPPYFAQLMYTGLKSHFYTQYTTRVIISSFWWSWGCLVWQ